MREGVSEGGRGGGSKGGREGRIEDGEGRGILVNSKHFPCRTTVCTCMSQIFS